MFLRSEYVLYKKAIDYKKCKRGEESTWLQKIAATYVFCRQFQVQLTTPLPKWSSLMKLGRLRLLRPINPTILLPYTLLIPILYVH